MLEDARSAGDKPVETGESAVAADSGALHGTINNIAGTKRSHENASGPQVMETNGTADPLNGSHCPPSVPADKRARRDDSEVCDEAEAWAELSSESPHTTGLEPVVRANVFVSESLHDLEDTDDEEEKEDDKGIHSDLIIKIAWLGGSCREAPNQILFYLKNRLK